MSDVLAVVSPSAPRRLLGTAVMAALGVMLIWLAVSTAPQTGWRLILLVFGGVAIAGAVRLWRATAARVELTDEVLRDSDGVVLARVDSIVSVDRGAFALKPSNGFVLKLDRRHPRAWAPGLWWRSGRHVGVGGVTSAGEGKAMAERLALMLADRPASRDPD